MNAFLIPLRSAAKKIILSAATEKMLAPIMIKTAKIAVRYIQQKDLIKDTTADEKFFEAVIEVLEQIERSL